MPEVRLTTTAHPSDNRPDLKRETAIPAEQDKLVGQAIQNGFTGTVVRELVGQDIAQQSQVIGYALAFMPGSDAEGPRQANEGGQQTSLGNVLDRLRQSETAEGANAAKNAASSIDSIKEQRSESYKAVKAAGNELVPHLKKAVRSEHKELFTNKVKENIKATVAGISSTADRLDSGSVKEALDHAIFSKLAYKGVDRPELKYPLPAGFEPAASDDLPAALRPCYDSQSGLLEMPRKGAKALVVKNADKLVVAFAGTEPIPGTGRHHTSATDIVQRLGLFDPMYRDAAGIVGMILNHPENRERTVHLTGHSLGGGLALFSNIANTPGKNAGETTNREGMKTYAFNPAGLSTSYLTALGEERVARSVDRLTTVRVAGDPVSYSGISSTGLLKGRTPGKTVTLTPPPEVFPSAPKGLTAHFIDTAIEVVGHALRTGGNRPPDQLQ